MNPKNAYIVLRNVQSIASLTEAQRQECYMALEVFAKFIADAEKAAAVQKEKPTI